MTKILIDEAVVRQALEALKDFNYEGACEKEIAALRQALVDAALDKMADNAKELGLGYEPAPAQPLTDEQKAVINAARAAMDASTEADNGEGGIVISSEHAASLSLCLDDYDRAIKAAHGITKVTP